MYPPRGGMAWSAVRAGSYGGGGGPGAVGRQPEVGERGSRNISCLLVL